MRTSILLKLIRVFVTLGFLFSAVVWAEEGGPIGSLEAALESAKEGSSEARQRLAVRRVIRDAEGLLESAGESPERWQLLEFLFRARQQLVALDDDKKHREALVETCRQLVNAPDELAELRLEADLLLSQAELAKKGASNEVRAEALRPFVDRYLDTPVGAKVVRLAMVMALELGDNRLVTDLREVIEERFAADLEMISFQRDRLGGQVFGAPFAGVFERSDGKVLRFPMDGLGRSTMFLFWSKEAGGEDLLKGIAATAVEIKEDLAGRLEIISVNLDQLPDAGELFVRGLGLDWQVLRLPEGKDSDIFKAYVRSDPKILTVSPTGYAAMIMSGSTRQKANSDGEPDYARMFQSTLARNWTNPRYVQQLSALMAGDFLVLDPVGGIDSAKPPEWKALVGTGGELKPFSGEGGVPAEALSAIQECFIAPPQRYRATHQDVRGGYQKAVELCRETIRQHGQASDLWLVRNRLIIGLLGLWKTDADQAKFDEAVAEAEVAMAAGYPKGCDVIARFCLARAGLHKVDVDASSLVQQFVLDSGGESAPGVALAAASLLSLETADRSGFEKYRDLIIGAHLGNPMMWNYSAFLLDRHHRYWLFQVPFTAGWSYGRRENYFLTRGDPDEGDRVMKARFSTLEGKPFDVPEALEGDWNAIVFAAQPPWSSKRDDGLPPSPERLLKSMADVAAKRPAEDFKVYLAVLGDDADAVTEALAEKEWACKVLMVPRGTSHPVAQQLGILSEDEQHNSVLLERTGRIASFVSGLAKQTGRGSGTTLTNVIEHLDELRVSKMISDGQVAEAKELIFGLAPPFDPEAVDERGRKLKQPQYSLDHLRARARVHLALGELEAALADAEEVVERQLGTDGGMSLRTDELDESEALRDKVKAAMESR